MAKVVELLVEAGHLDLKRDLYRWHQTGGASNRYTFVWGNAIKHSKARMEQQLKELWAYAEGVAAEELKDQTPESFAVVSCRAGK